MKLKELAEQLNMLVAKYGDQPVLSYDGMEEAMTELQKVKICTPEEAIEDFYCAGDNPVEYDSKLKNAKAFIVLVGN